MISATAVVNDRPAKELSCDAFKLDLTSIALIMIIITSRVRAFMRSSWTLRHSSNELISL